MPSAGIEPSLWSFVNHGCNGTYNIGTPLNVTEVSLTTGTPPNDLYDDENEVFDPFSERHYPAWGCSDFVALRDIEAGEELFDNYLVFGGSKTEDWLDNLQELQSVCSGGIGLVSSYEASAAKA